MLYCICRRPHDQRAMIACDKCDEWYHFDCIKISSAPKVYICPACDPCPNGNMPPPELTAQDRQVVIVILLYDGIFKLFQYGFFYKKLTVKCVKKCMMKGDL